MRREFTLLEIVVTISMIAIFFTLSIRMISRVPSHATLQNCIENVKSVFTCARSRAMTTGVTQTVIFSREDNRFYLNCPEWNGKVTQYYVPSSISVVINKSTATSEDSNFTYYCFADGIISGYDFKFITAKNTIMVNFSPLTGNIFTDDEKTGNKNGYR